MSAHSKIDTLIGSLFLVGGPVAASYYAGTIANESSRAVWVPFIVFGLVYLIALNGLDKPDESQ